MIGQVLTGYGLTATLDSGDTVRRETVIKAWDARFSEAKQERNQ